MGTKKSLVNRQQGSAAVVTIILVILLLAIGKAVFLLNRAENAVGNNFRSGIAAQYLAEGGARRAIFELNKDINWKGVAADIGTAPNNGHLVITVKPANDVIWVTSTATVNSDDRFNTAQRIVGFAYIWPPERNNYTYDYAVFSGGQMTVCSGAAVKTNRPEQTHAMVGSRSTINNSGTIDNGLEQNRTDIQVPVIDRNSYQQGAPPPPSTAEIDSYHGLTGRIYYYTPVRGESYAIADYRKLPGNGVIYSQAAVLIGEGVKLPGRVTIISEASITVKRNARLDKALLVARQNIEIAENVQITGCVVAGDILNIKEGTEIVYDPDVRNMVQTNYWFN